MSTQSTDEEKRAKIAEALGWKERKYTNEYNEPKTRWVRPGGDNLGQGYILPDYLNDLNACHEMERALTVHQRTQYLIAINGRYMGGCHGTGPSFYDWWKTTHAGPRERCDAFLATIL